MDKGQSGGAEKIILERLSALHKPRLILAVDGMAAAGKTTLAAGLGAPVIHMDDFFLPVSLRTPERLAEPGGNVHYERFLEEVLPALRVGRPFAYRRFSCGVMDYDGAAEIPAAPLVVVEGAYALHPSFGRYADLTVFLEIGAEEQKARILRRNGPAAWAAFRDRWIPMENTYHAAFRLRETADLVLGTGDEA